MPDTIIGTSADDRLDGTTAAELIRGCGGDDVLYGDGYAPGISGEGQAPAQYIGGDDTLKGGSGDDWLSGGHGADKLVGGCGADVFSLGTHVPFNTDVITPDIFVLDTGVGEGARRHPRFRARRGRDRPLAPAEPGLPLPRRGRVLRIHRHGGVQWERAQVRYTVDGDRTIVQFDGTAYLSGNVVGVDGVVDGEIELCGAHTLEASDFVL